jgi:hypothetical protein
MKHITLQKELYNPRHYPDTGQHILAHTQEGLIVVYQAYRPEIANYAIEHGVLGGPAYSFNRMSWIKPNFLWMMFRSGWAQKEGQEKVLAFWIEQEFFDKILAEAVPSSFNTSFYPDTKAWKDDLDAKEVRLQWDPDHDPYGQPESRRAIQLGLKGNILKEFATTGVKCIEDVTPFVLEQYVHVQKRELDKLMIPVERVYRPHSTVGEKVGIDL